MSDWLSAFIARHARDGHIDEEVLLREQAGLTTEQILELRNSPEIARLVFGVEELANLDAAYYFWDTTSVSFKQPLLDHTRDDMAVLEIGPGPAATLSLFLASERSGLRQTCAEIDPRFLITAREAVRRNRATIDVVASDMTAGVADRRFDVVFMNPPYVPTRAIEDMGISPGSGAAQAGTGGDDGLAVVRRFLREVPAVLSPRGKALLGINTRYVPAGVIEAAIDVSPMRLTSLAYPADAVQPAGPRSQVFVLETR